MTIRGSNPEEGTLFSFNLLIIDKCISRMQCLLINVQLPKGRLQQGRQWYAVQMAVQ